MARSPKPMPLWLPIAAAACFAIAALLQSDTLSRVLFGASAVLFTIVAVMQWRMQRRDR